jgi:hypothetical protein
MRSLDRPGSHSEQGQRERITGAGVRNAFVIGRSLWNTLLSFIHCRSAALDRQFQDNRTLGRLCKPTAGSK